MAFLVLLTDDAARDLVNIDEYITWRDSPEAAEKVLCSIDEVLQSLADNPGRGNHPKELSMVGLTLFREVRYKPYRIVYRIIEKTVYVQMIADGRRDMQRLLHDRLVRGASWQG